MASASPSDREDSELTCSICLDTFDCPSTLSCGHSFCLKCLDGFWKKVRSFSCPQCRATFSERPQLTRNVTLANLVEQHRVAEKMAGVVFCDSCGDGETHALKTCLKCETSFCESHLEPHMKHPKLKDHVLVAPVVNLEERRCQQHGDPYKFFCTQDGSLVCRDCTIAGDHMGHQVITLKHEHKTRKNRIGEETRAVEKKREEEEASVRRMEAARQDVQVSMSQTKTHILREFTRMRTKLDQDEKEALRRVDVKGRELLSRIEETIAHHQREIREMRAAAAHLRALEQEMDSLSFLQGHLKETSRRDAQKRAPPSPPSKKDIATISTMKRAVVKLLPYMYGRSPTLDTNSANNELQISSDLRTVTRSGVSQGRPDHPHRFDTWVQALCSDNFSRGQHYWEVNVGDAVSCMIGVAYGTIARKGSGKESRLGASDSSWVLCKSKNSCSMYHGGAATPLEVQDPPRTVGCHLHWEAGLLEFYRTDSMQLLHSVHHAFTQPLYPALSVGVTDGDSVKILDLCPES